jgi:hypothetical protein
MQLLKTASAFAAVAFALSVTSTAQAASTAGFIDSFENPENTQNWQVYDDFGDWTSEGAGIEIQTSGVVVDAYDGDQYVELDSHSNSSMTRLVDLGGGDYTLSWYYQPRTGTTNDNVIEVVLEGVNIPVRLDLDPGDGVRTQNTDWELISSNFSLDTAGTYALTFSAAGVDNSLGGFIDLVSLAPRFDRDIGEVPLPAAAWLFLSVLGAGGMLRRFKSKA